MAPIITVENLSKRYFLSHNQQESYTAMRDVIADKVKGVGRMLAHPFSSKHAILNSAANEEFWALNDVSFSVNRGDRVGIIGRNGAGKSTLLKILSRITEPTSGKVGINGRVASLLEVGTGFHPELTGRENVFLNGAILGMGRGEIRRKFDEIVAFAEVEKFLDTPVKRYSSGMYVRLAFAVAAHLEPEILIVDEVLAVGDAQFQKKCLGKMEDVGREGRTVLFVSHNMAAVRNLCNRAILLKHGKKVADGTAEDVMETYLCETSEHDQSELLHRRDRQGTGTVRFKAVRFFDDKGQSVTALRSGAFAKILLEIDVTSQNDLTDTTFSVGVDDHFGNRIAVLTSEVLGGIKVSSSVRGIEVIIPRLPLQQGRYGYTLFCARSENVLDWVQNAGHFMVEADDFYGSGKLPATSQGSFLMDYSFNVA